jgi:elongation factor 2
MCEIQAPDDALGGIYNCLSQRRGVVIGEEPVQGTPLLIIKAYLPVAESFGFTQHLRAMTSGRAFPQCVFDHWEMIASDPFEAASKSGQIVEAIRKRKGLKVGIPTLDNFVDKL